MSNFLKGKLSYASLSKPKREKPSAVLQGREGDCIYESILNGMHSNEKDYISDLIKSKRRKEGRATYTKGVEGDSGEEEGSCGEKENVKRVKDESQDMMNLKAVRQPIRMNSPKLKHVQSLDEVGFLEERAANSKYNSTNTSFIFTDKLLGKKEKNLERKADRREKEERETFIGSLDGYINKLESVEVSKVRQRDYTDFHKDYEKKYKHLAQTYMEQITTSKQKEDKLLTIIKNLKKHVKQLEGKVSTCERQQNQFATLWRRREEQFGILLGIEQEIRGQVYGRGREDEGNGIEDSAIEVEMESGEEREEEEEEMENIRRTLKFDPEERRRKSRHTVNYY